jgi:hypothetical protein
MYCLHMNLLCYSFPLKGIRANNRFREGFRGLIETAETDHFKRLFRISRRIRSYIRNGLVRELGPEGE